MRPARHNRHVSSARHIVVAVNPTAAAGKNARAGDETVRQLEAAGHAVIRVQAESAGALRDALAARTAEFDTLVVVGGDGMVSLGVKQKIRVVATAHNTRLSHPK